MIESVVCLLLCVWVCVCLYNHCRQTKRERWPVPIRDKISAAPFVCCLHLFVSKSFCPLLSIHFLFSVFGCICLFSAIPFSFFPLSCFCLYSLFLEKSSQDYNFCNEPLTLRHKFFNITVEKFRMLHLLLLFANVQKQWQIISLIIICHCSCTGHLKHCETSSVPLPCPSQITL